MLQLLEWIKFENGTTTQAKYLKNHSVSLIHNTRNNGEKVTSD